MSCNKLSELLPAFTCAIAIGNLWSIYLGVSTLRLEWSRFKMPARLGFVKNILISKASGIFSLTSKKLYKFWRTISFSCFFSWLFGFVCFLKLMISGNKSVWYSLAFSRVILPL